MDNVNLFFAIFNLGNQSFFFDQLMIFGAVYLIYLVFFLLIFLGFKGGRNEKRAFLLSFIALPLGIVFVKLMHLFFFESRPFVAFQLSPLIIENTKDSFPSFHSTLSSTVAFCYLFSRSKWFILFFLLAIWIGFSRIFVGVHYPFDILTGFIVGFLAVLVANLIRKFLSKKLLTI